MGADRRVRHPVARQPCDLLLLRRQRIDGVRTLRRRTRSPVAASSCLARSANASIPISVRRSCAVRRCSPRLDPSALAAKPLPVEQVRSGEVGSEPGPRQALDGLAVRPVCVFAGGEHRGRAGPGRRAPNPRRSPTCARASRASASAAAIRVAGPARGLDQFAQGPRRHVASGRTPDAAACGGSLRVLVATQAVAEHRPGPVGVLDGRPLARGRRRERGPPSIIGKASAASPAKARQGDRRMPWRCASRSRP